MISGFANGSGRWFKGMLVCAVLAIVQLFLASCSTGTVPEDAESSLQQNTGVRLLKI